MLNLTAGILNGKWHAYANGDVKNAKPLAATDVQAHPTELQADALLVARREGWLKPGTQPASFEISRSNQVLVAGTGAPSVRTEELTAAPVSEPPAGEPPAPPVTPEG